MSLPRLLHISIQHTFILLQSALPWSVVPSTSTMYVSGIHTHTHTHTWILSLFSFVFTWELKLEELFMRSASLNIQWSCDPRYDVNVHWKRQRWIIDCWTPWQLQTLLHTCTSNFAACMLKCCTTYIQKFQNRSMMSTFTDHNPAAFTQFF